MLIRKIKISSRAYVSMLCELQQYPTEETGGFLLGYISDESMNIIEATDPGKDAVRRKAGLQCDMEHLGHTMEVLKRLYEPSLVEVGVWHKHNHSYEPPFSKEDIDMHIYLSSLMQTDIVSILFQRMNDENEYGMRVFLCNQQGETEEVEFEIAELNDMISYAY